MRIMFRYHRDTDRLVASRDAAECDEFEWIEAGSGLRIGANRSRSEAVSFTIDGVRHFVSYHPIWRLFGDEGLRQFATFQSRAVSGSSDCEQTVEVALPKRHEREVRELLRSHLLV